jgi:drug/metabolite transporter (DMT)-like permease
MAGTTAADVVPVARPVRGDAYELADWGLLGVTAAIWGASFLFIAIGLEAFPPALVTLLRLGAGATTLALVPRARRAVPREAWPRIALLGVLWMGIPFLLFPYAQQWIDSSLAGMLNGAVPLTTAAFATLLARRAPGGRQLAGLALGFAGVVVVSLPAVRGASATALGTGLVMVATVFYGLALNLAVPLQQRYGTLPVLLRAELVAAVAVAPLGLAALPSASFDWASAAAVVALGCLGTALAFVGLVTLVGRVGATRASITIYFTPILAIALGAAFRDERITLAAVAGTALVVGGAWLTSRADRAAAPAAARPAEG